MTRHYYWREAAEYALDAAGVECTPEQLESIAESLESSADNQGLATGHEFIPSPLSAQIREIEARHERELAEMRHHDRLLRECIASKSGGRIEARKVIIHNGRVEFMRD